MSVVFCYRCDYFSIIATDTRIMYGNEKDAQFRDDEIKLRECKKYYAWLAGVGANTLIDKFGDFLDNFKISEFNDIDTIFKIALLYTENENSYSEDEIEHSGISVSALSPNTDDIFKIYLWSQFNKENLSELCRVVLKNEFYIMFPSDFGINSENYINFNQKYNRNYIFDGDYNKFLKYVCSMFKEVSDLSYGVSGNIDIGMSMILSDENENDIVGIQIREPIDELILHDNIFSKAKAKWSLAQETNNGNYTI